MGIKRIGGGMAVNQITEGVIWKQLLYFFFPILFGTFFQQLYNTADAVIVGQFVGTQALAAVGGATGSLINFFVNLFVGLASGTTVVIAQAYGAHDAESVGGTVHTSVALALAAGLGLTAVGVAAAPWALSAMGTPADIMDFALIYLRVSMAQGIRGAVEYLLAHPELQTPDPEFDTWCDRVLAAQSAAKAVFDGAHLA